MRMSGLKGGVIKRIFLVALVLPIRKDLLTATVWVARHFKSSVLIVHVTDLKEEPASAGVPSDVRAHSIKRAILEDLRAAKSQISGAGIATKTIYYEGSPVANELGRLIKQRRADVLIIDADGGADSLGLRIVAKTQCAVMLLGESKLARSRWRTGIDKLLYLTPFQPQSLAGAKLALRAAGELHARLDVIHIVDDEGSENNATFLSEMKRLSGQGYRDWLAAMKLRWKPDMPAALEVILDEADPQLLLVEGSVVAELQKSPDDHSLQGILKTAACPVMILPTG